MISAGRLSYGNYVIHPITQKPIRVLEISEKAIGVGTDKVEDVLIPSEIIGLIITPDVLVKCGFKEAEERLFIEIDANSGFVFYEHIGHVQLEVNIDAESCWIGEHINYLHQLQNAYSVLTFKELEISL